LDTRVLVDGDFRTLKGKTPLEEGTRYGKTSTVDTLLQNMSEKEIIQCRVIKAAAENREYGKEILTLLIEKRGDNFQLTTDVVKAAVAYSTHNVMKLLLEKRGNQFQIIGDVVKAAAQNKENGKEILTLLLEQ
jgi:hypothetical protein